MCGVGQSRPRTAFFFAVAIQYLAGQGVGALPVPNLDRSTSSSDQPHFRTTWNIVSSCVAIIFSCIWVALHPNIPSPDDSPLRIALRRAKLMLMALIAPELIVLWAMQQWLVSRRLADKYQGQDRRWTQSHGFFVIIGGFMLFEGDEATQTLTPDLLESLSDAGKIDFPEITENEIQDRSKGDGLTKGLVVIHTSWFILQCIARGVAHLPITEFEIMTLAFAVLNFVTYGLWWHKPLNVRCPVHVLLKENSGNEGEGEGEGEKQGDGQHGPIQRPWCRDMLMELFEFVERFGHMSGGGDIEPRSKRVPTFYSGELSGDDDPRTHAVTGLVAVIFGAIHCIAWSFQFPSHMEQMLWRVSAIAIICVPVLFPLVGLFGFIHLPWLSNKREVLTILMVVILAFLYMLARVMLFILALLSLRTLPPEAYYTVIWTTYLPHIQ